MLSAKKIIPGEKKLSRPMLEAPITVRIRFCKVGNLQFISHLDLQRSFHRVLVRAGIPMWYTKGFNPHAKLVFGLPLSVGVESVCEMADLKIERQISLDEIKNQLNAQLTDEMYIIDAYYPTTKFSDIAYSSYTLTIQSYKIADDAAERAKDIFSSPIMMTKKSKSGEKEVNILDYIKNINFSCSDGKFIVNTVVSSGSTENLNPEYIVTALRCSNVLGEKNDRLDYSIMRNAVYDKYLIEFK